MARVPLTYNDVENEALEVLKGILAPSIAAEVAGMMADALVRFTPGYREGRLLCACNRAWVDDVGTMVNGHGYEDCEPGAPIPAYEE